jgi:hypothetical protein
MPLTTSPIAWATAEQPEYTGMEFKISSTRVLMIAEREMSIFVLPLKQITSYHSLQKII